MSGRLLWRAPVCRNTFKYFLVDHHGSCHVVTQPFALRADPRAQNPNAVGKRQLVDDAKQIAAYSVDGSDGLAGVLDDANVGQALSRCLAIPDRFKQHKVPVHEQKKAEDNECGYPDISGRRLTGPGAAKSTA